MIYFKKSICTKQYNSKIFKNTLIKIFLLILPICLFPTFIVSSASTEPIPLSAPYPFIADKFNILDTRSKNSLPNRFRDIKDLNISGSAQFVPSQLDDIKKAVGTDNITIVDLRQESHGFVDDTAISFYSLFKLINSGLSSKETLKSEKKDLSSIAKEESLNLYSKSGEFKKTIEVKNVLSEGKAVKNANLNYVRFAVRDAKIPTPSTVDDFIEFIVNLDSNEHLHFHCHQGQGRTTTFMVLYQMMKNKNKIPLEDILKEQVTNGGIVLTDNKSRAKFLEYFYNYTLENMDSNYKTSYSSWLSSNKLTN